MYKLLFRTIAVYVALCAIPVLLFGFFVYGGVADGLHKHMVAQQTESLHSVLRQLEQFSARTREVSEELALRVQGGALRESDIDAAMEQLRSEMDGVARIVYFSRREGLLYDGGWQPLEQAPPEGQGYRNDLGDARGTPYPLETGEMILLYPLQFGNGISERSVGFVLSGDSVFAKMGGEGEIAFSLYAGDNTLLMANHSGSVLRYAGENGQVVSYNGSDYLCHSGHVTTTNWRYVALFPAAAHPVLEGMRGRMILAVALLLAVSGGLILCGVRLTYRPVQQMVTLIERKAQKNLRNASFGEIMEALQSIILSRNSLSSKANLQHRLILDQFVRFLLRGEMTGPMLEERQQDLGIRLNKPCFHLYRIGVRVQGEPLSRPPYALVDEINEYQENVFAIIDNDGSLIVLYNFYPDFKISIGPLLDLLYGYVDPAADVKWEIQESALYSDIFLTGPQYLELCLADRQPQIGGLGHISCIQYEGQDLNRIQNAMLRGDHAGAYAVLEEAVEKIAAQQPDGKSVKFFLYEALKLVTGMLEVLHIPPERMPVQDSDILYALDAGEISMCLACFRRWFEAMGGQGRAEEEQLIDRIQAIIRREFASSQFSVHTIASETGYSYNYISRHFKEKTGQNLSDNITLHRMRRFKELLLAGNDTVQALIQQVGYDNDASFIRKFKKLEGVTPAQYRKLYS